jgi:exportin-1
MACDTFIKIAQKCKRHFVIQQANEYMPFIDEILKNIDAITSDLMPQQVHTFYEAAGHMISAQTSKQQSERLITKLMELPNQSVWFFNITSVGQNNGFSCPECGCIKQS